MSTTSGASLLRLAAAPRSPIARGNECDGGRAEIDGGPVGRGGQTPMADLQRARILAAMAEVCSERGAANVTVAHVVARSGVSRRTFYELFEDREDCFLAAMEQALAGVSGHVLPAYAGQDRWIERIRAGLFAALEYLEEEPYMGRLLVVETLGAGGKALRRRQEVLAALIDAVDEGRLTTKASAELPRLTAEGVAGGVLSVLHARLLQTPGPPLRQLAGQLMSMIVLPYLGATSARRELSRPLAPEKVERGSSPGGASPANPLHALKMRLTYRTVRVLASVGALPGSSNREIGHAAEVSDQGQISKLLTRLEKLGLIENAGAGGAPGAPNAWLLTVAGQEVHHAIAERAIAPQEITPSRRPSAARF